MNTIDNPADLLAGIDNLSLDERKFDPSQDDIERICRFFSLGKLQRYKKEKGIIVSHSNFFVYAATAQGQYALKFYPPQEAKTVAIEYSINRLLANHHFSTPAMHAGRKGQPFLASKGRIAACFTYIDGSPAWQHIKQRDTYQKINAAILSLNNLLSAAQGRVPFEKQTPVMATVKNLAQASRSMDPFGQKKTVDAALQEALRAYQRHQQLFTRRLVHNNINLANLLIAKKTIYTLDLSHIREDYELSDLASLVISCLFFDIPFTTIKAIAKDYFSRHKIKTECFLLLNTLVQLGLIREYLKNIQREKSIELAPYPPGLVRTYRAHLSKRKELITAVSKKINAKPRLIV